MQSQSPVTGQGAALVWTKSPSVTRHGHFFYRAKHGVQTFTVLQSWITGAWEVEARPAHKSFPSFKTSHEAMTAVNREVTQ